MHKESKTNLSHSTATKSLKHSKISQKNLTYQAAKKRLKAHDLKAKKVLAAASLGFCLEMMDIMLLSYALAPIMLEFNLSAASGGFIASATNLAMLAGGLFFGAIANRLGYVRSFAGSIYLFSLGTALIYFAPNFFTLLVLRVLAGFGAGGEYGLSMAFLASCFKKKELGKYSAYVGIFGQIGFALAAIAAGILLKYGWRELFLIGLIPLALGIFVHKNLDEPKLVLDKKINFFEAFANKGAVTAALIFMACVQIAGYFGLMSWLPTLAAKALNLQGAIKSSWWMLSTIAGMCVGMMSFGRLLDKYGPMLSFGIFLIGSSAGVYGFSLVASYEQLLLAGFAVGFFSNGMFAGYGALISRYYDAYACAFANNLIIGCGRAVGGFSPFAIGWALDAGYSQSALMIAIAGLYMCSFCVCMIFLKEIR